jgi:hypothetical protein
MPLMFYFIFTKERGWRSKKFNFSRNLPINLFAWQKFNAALSFSDSEYEANWQIIIYVTDIMEDLQNGKKITPWSPALAAFSPAEVNGPCVVLAHVGISV